VLKIQPFKLWERNQGYVRKDYFSTEMDETFRGEVRQCKLSIEYAWTGRMKSEKTLQSIITLYYLYSSHFHGSELE
jgi:hypothetical protein